MSSSLLENLESTNRIVKDYWLPHASNLYKDSERMEYNDKNFPIRYPVDKTRKSIERVKAYELSQVEFMRRYVGTGRPVVIEGGIEHWNATFMWDSSLKSLEKINDNIVSMTISPTGRADALATLETGEEVFIAPEEIKLPFKEVLKILRNRYCSEDSKHFQTEQEQSDIEKTASCGYPYLSIQNDNLRKEMSELLEDLAYDATVRAKNGVALFPEPPEAVNLWIGGEGNTSTTHKDHFENLYSVVSGVKRFCLHPPSDILWLYERRYKPLRCHHNNDLHSSNCDSGFINPSGRVCAGKDIPACWSLSTGEDAVATSMVPWISVDPENVDLERYPLYKSASPVWVDVAAGDTLYLPAMWYHQVSHPELRTKSLTIAVNSWFEMDYMSQAYAYMMIMRKVSLLTTRESSDTDEDEVDVIVPDKEEHFDY